VNANSAVGGRIRRFFNKDFSDHHGSARPKNKDLSSSVPMPAICGQKKSHPRIPEKRFKLRTDFLISLKARNNQSSQSADYQ
jgi:hypothetical protein